jgi:hypothetical protein
VSRRVANYCRGKGSVRNTRKFVMLYLVLEIGVAPRCKCVQKGGNITIAPARGTIRSDWYGNSVKPPSSTFLK